MSILLGAALAAAMASGQDYAQQRVAPRGRPRANPRLHHPLGRRRARPDRTRTQRQGEQQRGVEFRHHRRHMGAA